MSWVRSAKKAKNMADKVPKKAPGGWFCGEILVVRERQ